MWFRGAYVYWEVHNYGICQKGASTVQQQPPKSLTQGHRKQIESGEAISSVEKYQWGGPSKILVLTICVLLLAPKSLTAADE